ncbi:MAG: hypothetical protein RMH97_01515, partial [Verrucomicrobiales bacterium]|nr:hypothetical protein [Verrucomicrobiales bacterium]
MDAYLDRGEQFQHFDESNGSCRNSLAMPIFGVPAGSQVLVQWQEMRYEVERRHDIGHAIRVQRIITGISLVKLRRFPAYSRGASA